MKKIIIQEKSFDFALSVIDTVQQIRKVHNEYVISKQLLKSGTAIGAMVREAEHAESRKDFIHKMNIALKEANETKYWLDLLSRSKHFEEFKADDLRVKCLELVKILAAIVKSTRLRTMSIKS